MFLKRINCISMVPYPSGLIHIGHIKNYIINELLNRFFKLKIKYSTMFIAWDCFGTPAENASLIYKIIPIKFLYKSIFYMILQLKYNNFSIDWLKQFNTSDINYYYFNNLIFLKFFKKKIIYIDNKNVNWDPCEKSVLSDEQVIDKKGWRSLCLIKKLNILTYYIYINSYKLEILNELLNLSWPYKIKLIQINWIIQKKYNYFINFFFFFNLKLKIKIKSFLFLFFKYNIIFLKFKILKESFNKFFLNRFFFIKTFLNQKLEFFILEIENVYFNFYKKFNIFFIKKKLKIFFLFFLKNLLFFDLLSYFKFKKLFYLKYTWNINNWGVSRQKYWGSTIPSYFCKFCNKYYTFKNIPQILPKNQKNNNFFYYKKINKLFCHFCKNPCFKESYTIDSFFDSSWYYLKYFKYKNKVNFNNPIDIYIGGSEHAILHLLYSRYIIKSLRDLKYLNFCEPFLIYFPQGMILYLFNKKINKMSKSKGNVINPENIIINNNSDSLRVSILKNSLSKDLIWNDNLIVSNFKFINIFFKIFNFKKIKVDIFFYKLFFLKNFKIFLYFFYKNLKKILIFYKNVINLNLIYIYMVKIIKIFKKNFFLKNFNYFNLLIFFFDFFKYFYPIIPLIITKLYNNLFFFKFLRIKKIYFNKIFNILKKKIFLLKKIFFLKKKLDSIFFNKIFKKKIFNYLFFKKKILKKFISKIINIKYLLNVLY